MLTNIFSFCIDPPPPSHLQLVKVNKNELVFTWEPYNRTGSCPSLYYEPLSNCSECAATSDYAKCRTSIITSDAKVCSFAIRTVVCGNIVGTKSETMNIVLKGLN